jgi:GTP:adenosylcobinamide-phosphate guanylyltransferase
LFHILRLVSKILRAKVVIIFLFCHLFLILFVPLQPKAKNMKQAMILAAGLGTRLKPLTDTMPKALVPVGGSPLLDLNIRKLQAQGYDRFIVNIHHFAQQIRDYVAQQDYAPLVRFSDESEQLLETGGGLKKAQELFRDDEPILIHNVDILDNVDYEWFSHQHQEDEDAVLLVSKRKTKRYLLFDNAMRLMGWMNRETGEIKSPFPWLRTMDLTIDDELNVTSHLSPLTTQLYAFAFSGIHSFSPRLFALMDRFPDRFPIIDFYLSICHRSPIVGLVKNDLRLMDVGKLDTLDQAENFIKTL